MEKSEAVDFLSALVPFTIIIFVIAVGVLLLTQQFRKNLYKQQLAKEELKNQHQHELLQNSINVQEQERKRIAQDLHDELGATLSMSRMQLVQLESKFPLTHDSQKAQMQLLRRNLEEALASARRISHELMPAQLVHVGLFASLEALGEKVRQASTVEMHVQVPDRHERLSWETELGLYRMATELVNNSLKHAGATKMELHFELNENGYVFHFKDNGKGLPDDLSHAGLGLKGLEGRAKALNSHLQYGNGENGGFYARITRKRALN